MMPVRRAVRAGALRLVAFILARPALDAFLRRQIYRFPGLAGRARAAVSRSRRAHLAAPSVVTDEAGLTDAARQVLRDLAYAIDRQRHS